MNKSKPIHIKNRKILAEDLFNFIADNLFPLLSNEYPFITKMDVVSSLSIPDIRHGDISSNIAFFIASKIRKKPYEISAHISKLIKSRYIRNRSAGHNHGYMDWISSVNNVGPYINFRLSYNYIYNMLLDMHRLLDVDTSFSPLQDSILDVDDAHRVTVYVDCVVEYPSVNPNKPWHLGHLRNALIGDVISNLKTANGYRVLRMDYIDDLGLQVAQTVWYLLKSGHSYETGEKYDHFLGKVYVEASKELESSPGTDKDIRDILIKMEDVGNNEISKHARAIAELCVSSQYDTAYAFYIYHDILVFESDVVSTIMKHGLDMLKGNTLCYVPKTGDNLGCLVVKVSQDIKNRFGLKNDEKVLIRSDGTATYTGKDIIFHMWKLGILKDNFYFDVFDTLQNGYKIYKSTSKSTPQRECLQIEFVLPERAVAINVIGMEQSYPQAIVSDIINTLSNGKKMSVHVPYAHVRLPGTRFSGRKGTWLGYTADDFIREMKDRIYKMFYKDYAKSGRSNKKSDEEISKDFMSFAHKIAVAAIRYSFLKVHPNKEIVFDWDSALDTNGNSGPYLQYAMVRAKSILRKMNIDYLDSGFVNGMRKRIGNMKDNEKYILSDIERELSILILYTKRRVMESGLSTESCDIPAICGHAFNLASMFNKFYTTHRVIDAESDTAKDFRVCLLLSFVYAMLFLFRILGIPEIDVM